MTHLCFFAGLNAPNIVFGDDQTNTMPVDLSQIGQLEHLDELRLKSASGYLQFDNFTENLHEFVTMKAEKLSKLSLLSLKTISVDNLMAITQLTALKHLELGNCDLLEPQNLFLRLSELSNLKYLRLERGKFNENMGVLSGLKSLTDLELIDFEMLHGCGQGLISLQGIRKLLLIPTYKDDVSINLH